MTLFKLSLRYQFQFVFECDYDNGIFLNTVIQAFGGLSRSNLTSEFETATSDPERRLQDDHRRREAARRQQLLPDHRDHHERARVQFHVLQGVKQRRKLV